MLEPVVPYACTRPKPPRTGLQLPRCYARAMNDCSPVLSAEHYISRNVLEALGGKFRVQRPRWWGEGTRELNSDALTAKILCERHNNYLSPVDVAGGKFVEALRHAHERAANGGGRVFLNGFDVERWLLKMLCAYVCLDRDEVPEPWARIVFCFNDLVHGCGLHINVAVGDEAGGAGDEIVFETAHNKERQRTGCRLSLFGHRFYLSMDGRRQYDEGDLGKQSILRPSHLRWKDPRSGATFELAFSWPGAASGDGISMTINA